MEIEASKDLFWLCLLKMAFIAFPFWGEDVEQSRSSRWIIIGLIECRKWGQLLHSFIMSPVWARFNAVYLAQRTKKNHLIFTDACNCTVNETFTYWYIYICIYLICYSSYACTEGPQTAFINVPVPWWISDQFVVAKGQLASISTKMIELNYAKDPLLTLIMRATH